MLKDGERRFVLKQEQLEQRYRRKILISVYGTMGAAMLFGAGVLYWILGQSTAALFMAAAAGATGVSLWLLSREALTAAAHFEVIMLSLAFFLTTLYEPKAQYHLIAFIVPILLAGLSGDLSFILTYFLLLIFGFWMVYVLRGGDLLFHLYIFLTYLTAMGLLIGYTVYRRFLSVMRTRMEEETIDAALFALGYTAELRDLETGNHLDRVSRLSELVARRLRSLGDFGRYVTESYIRDLCRAAVLHDVGKVVIPDQILLKPGPLTVEEFDLIKTHTVRGAEIIDRAEQRLEESSVFTMARQIALAHHERWNGSGYPRGLSAGEIPLSAQIVAVADVYDALASERPYKEPFPHARCVEIIHRDRGILFSPEVVDCFLEVEDQIEELYSIPDSDPDVQVFRTL